MYSFFIQHYCFRPKAVVERFGLKKTINSETAAYGHMGRDSYEKEVPVNYVTIKEENGVVTESRKAEMKKVVFFGWERLDYFDQLKKALL